AVRDLSSHLAAELADLALELANTSLAGVARDDLAQGVVGERQLTATQTVLGQLPGNEIPFGDLELLALGVAREVDRLQPIKQRSGDALRSEEHTSELQSRVDLVCRLL